MAILKLEVKDELIDDIAEGLEYSKSGSQLPKGEFITQNIIKLVKSYAQRGRRVKAEAIIQEAEIPISDEDIKQTTK
jgi:hypothetical protein